VLTVTLRHFLLIFFFGGGADAVVKWLVLLLYIQEALGSNISPETNYPDRLFVAFLSPSRIILA
jgi:hypothetical protein